MYCVLSFWNRVCIEIHDTRYTTFSCIVFRTLVQFEYILVNFLCVCKSTVKSTASSLRLHLMQDCRLKDSSLLFSQRRYYQTALLLFVIDFGQLVLISYQLIIGAFVSYRYVEITITNGVFVIFFQLCFVYLCI